MPLHKVVTESAREKVRRALISGRELEDRLRRETRPTTKLVVTEVALWTASAEKVLRAEAPEFLSAWCDNPPLKSWSHGRWSIPSPLFYWKWQQYLEPRLAVLEQAAKAL